MEPTTEVLQVLYPEFSPEAAARFRAVRIQRGLTQIEVACALGCSQGLIAKIEAGSIRRVRFSYAVFKKFFGADADRILLGDQASTLREESSSFTDE